MLVQLTYNCDPESLGDVSQEAFNDAFENEIVAKYPNCFVHVKHVKTKNKSGLTGMKIVDADNLDPNWDALSEEVKKLAEKAFNYCCLQ